MIVVDASAALSALINHGPARSALTVEQLHAPHLIDSEIANSLRRQVGSGKLSSVTGHNLVTSWSQLAVTRYGTHDFLGRVWQLRSNLSAYDAGYVALAEALGCDLLTADGRLARAPGPRCVIKVVPA